MERALARPADHRQAAVPAIPTVRGDRISVIKRAILERLPPWFK